MSNTHLSIKDNAVQVSKFVAFSLGAGIIQTLSFTAFKELANFPYWPAYLIALTLSVLYNFTVNRKFTFKSANNVPVAMLKVFAYYCVFTPVSLYLGDLASKAGINDYIVLAVTMICNLSTEFLFCRFVVYHKSINTNDMAKKK